MKRNDATPTTRPPRPACAPPADKTDRRGDAPGPQCDQAERPDKPRICDFRATACLCDARRQARQIVTQLDIEAAMWQMLGKEPER